MFTAGEVEFITMAVDGKYVDWNIIPLQFLVEAIYMYINRILLRVCGDDQCSLVRLRYIWVYVYAVDLMCKQLTIYSTSVCVSYVRGYTVHMTNNAYT